MSHPSSYSRTRGYAPNPFQHGPSQIEEEWARACWREFELCVMPDGVVYFNAPHDYRFSALHNRVLRYLVAIRRSPYYHIDFLGPQVCIAIKYNLKR